MSSALTAMTSARSNRHLQRRKYEGMPTAIIAKNLKGQGVSFMEGAVAWRCSNDEQYQTAMADLEKAGEALCQR